MNKPLLTFQDGYAAGQYDAQAGEPLAWQYDEGALQSRQWKEGYQLGKASLVYDSIESANYLGSVDSGL